MHPFEIRFEPVRAGDLPLLDSWLREPHVRKWWGDPETELGYIRDMVEGRDTTRPFIFHVDGEAVGYIQYWFIGHHQNEQWIKDYPWIGELPADTVGVDLSIGVAAKLSKGIGSTVLEAFVDRLVEEGWRNIIIDPDPANTRALRAYEKAGFKTLPSLVGKSDDCVILQYDLTERQKST
ncbi:MAG: acetyltransferase [Alphaproteobacteria bacterium]|nr:acetyltransferase [Alphaproteobacteria bacterium]